MKKKMGLLVGAVLLLAVLIGVYFVVKGNSSEEEESNETLLDLTADRIQAISWTPEGGETLSFHRVDGQWSYDGDPDFKVDQTAMNTVCSGVTGITLYQTLEDVTDLAQYGLDTPEYMLTVTDTEGNETEIALGDENDAVSSLYVYKNGDDKTVYSVMATLKSSIAKDLTELEATEDSSVDSTEDASEDTTEDSLEDASEDTTEDSSEDASEDTTEDSSEDTTEDSSENSAK